MSRRLKARYCLLDRAPAFVSLTNVGAQEDRFAAGFEYPRGYGMAALLIAAGDGNLRSLFCEKRAVASPMPEVPPVMSATLFFRRMFPDLEVSTASRRPRRPRLGRRAKLAGF